jgi:hypothetical protein
MPISKQMADGLLDTIAWLHPEYAPIIDFVKSHEDQLAVLVPVIQDSIKEGPGALAAAEKAAPELTQAIKHLVAVSPVASAVPRIAQIHAENVTRKIVGISPMSAIEETDYISQHMLG